MGEPNDTPPVDIGGGAPKPDSSGPQYNVYPVPGGGRVISWQEPNPNYNPDDLYGSAMGKNPQFITKTQYITDPPSANNNYTHTTERLVDPNQIEVEKIRAQNQIDIANANNQRQTSQDIGMFGNQPSLAAQQAVGSVNGQPTLDARKFGFDQFKYLSDIAANPRNFMQQNYLLRGFTPPAGSERFGTGGGFNLPGYGSTPGGYAMPGFASTSRAEPPMSPEQARNPRAGGGMTPGLYGSPANPNPMPTAVHAGPAITERRAGDMRPDAQLTAPNVYVGGGGQGAPGQQFQGVQGQAIAFNDHADAPIVGAPGGLDQPKFFSHGGVVPEPVAGVGLRSGQRYIFGEHGPEGVVPASYLPKFLQQRHGQQGAYAVGGEIGYDPYKSDPYGSDPYGSNTTSDTSSPIPSSSTQDASLDPGLTSGGGYTVLPTGSGFSAPTSPLPIPGVVPTPSPDSKLGNIPMPDSSNPIPAPSGSSPTSTVETMAPEQAKAPTVGPITLGGGVRTPQLPGGVPAPVTQQPPTVAPTDQFVQQPTSVPQGATTAAPATPGALTPRDVAPPGTFGATVGGGDSLGTFGSYLPRFLAGEDTPLANLVNQGMLPPWLGRVFAQEHGSSEFGTNQPQKFSLPQDVPLISHLAYLQMTPSERAQFSSFISSYGIDPGDYFDYVSSVGPQGPQAKMPTFGTPFTPNIGQV